MKALALRKRQSPNTHPVGPDKVNRSVTVTIICSCLFDRMARLWSVSVNFMLRRFIASGASAENHPQAAELRQALGVPSIHDLTTPKVKARICERDLRVTRASNPQWADAYVKEFVR